MWDNTGSHAAQKIHFLHESLAYVVFMVLSELNRCENRISESENSLGSAAEYQFLKFSGSSLTEQPQS